MTRDQQITAAYDAGESCVTIGRQFGVSKQYASRIAIDNGAIPRYERQTSDATVIALSSAQLLRAMLATGQHELDSLAIARIRGAKVGMHVEEVRRSVVVA